MGRIAVVCLLAIALTLKGTSDAQSSRKDVQDTGARYRRSSAAHLPKAKPFNPKKGRRKQKSGMRRPASVRKSKDQVTENRLNSLTEIFKANVERLSSHNALDLLFVIDESSSVGLSNFLDEIKFVSRLVSGIEVDMNHTRVAVVTFSDNVTAWVNQVSMNEIHAHKCSLLGQDLPNIEYAGGGTFTKGALAEIENILANARSDSKKAVFLITDGYSNGGNPRPVANALKRQDVELFTFGIKDGDKDELTAIASEPKSNHLVIVNSFNEFEIVARRALHSDLEAGRYIVEDDSHCNKFCTNASCCHGTADCRCGTTTGKYECVCRPGYYGTGLNDQAGCQPCPEGTYKDEALPGNQGSCIPCPDPKMNSPVASISLEQCTCAEGFKKVNRSCQALMCQDIQAPDNGYFVDCDRKYQSHCTAACNTGYDLQGTSTLICGIDENWTSINGTEPVESYCQVRYCEPIQAPENGEMECTKLDNSYATSCMFHCHEGYSLHGSDQRTCESQRKWTGADAECQEITCPALPMPTHGNFSGDCPTETKGKYGDMCSFDCPSEGYELLVAATVTCKEDGQWFPAIERENFKICNDTVPPRITCPEDMVLSTSPRSAFAHAVWNLPETIDNSGVVALSPTFEFPVSLRIGNHKIHYTASDDSGLSAHCDFDITVEDDEPPMIEKCIGPPAFIMEHGETHSDYIVWIEPTFSDNSGSLTVSSNSTFGSFPLGKSVIAYTARDEVGNARTCYINIHVQDHSCPPFEKPRRGYIDCSFPEENITECDLMCNSIRDGFAMNIGGNLHFTCNGKSWDPEKTIPLDCSKQKYSNQVLKDFEMTYSIGPYSCNDSNFLEGIRQFMFVALSEKIPLICEGQVEGLLTCSLLDVIVNCVTIKVTEPTPPLPPDYGYGAVGDIYGGDDDYAPYEYTEQEKKRKKRSPRMMAMLKKKHSKRLRRSEPEPPPVNDDYDTSALNSIAGYEDGYDDPDISLEMDSDLISDALPDAVKQSIEDVVGDVLPDELLNGHNDGTTQDKIHVHLTLRAEVPLEGTNTASDRKRHTRMVEFVRNLEMSDTISSSLSSVPASAINATNPHDLTYDEDSYLESKDELICPVGTVLKDKAFCVNCPVGTFYNVLNAECESCPIGFYQDLEAQLSCQSCPDRTSTTGIHTRGVEECVDFCSPGYTSISGLEDCIACPTGTFADSIGAKECTLCPPGNSTIGIAADSLDDCGELCRPQFISVTGFAPCQPCPVGSFQSEAGMTFCHVCPENLGLEMAQFVACTADISVETEIMPGRDYEIGKLYYNECFAKPCQNNATCIGQQTTFICECPPGYTGTVCETEINECLSNPCADTSSCVDLINGFRCDCDAGYTGIICNEEIDECASSPCNNGATCVDMINAFSCDCENGFSGLLCEVNVDECASDPCENEGVCVDEVDGFHCECQLGYTGVLCQTDIDDCAEGPCFNGATCIDGLSNFTCICTPGYSGDHCDENIDECASDPCINGECLDLINSFKCLCPPTYLGDHCEDVGDPYFDLEFDKPNTYHHSRIDYALPNMTAITISFYLRSNSTETYGTPFSYAVGDGLQADALALTDLAALTFYVNGKFAVSDLKRINDGKWYLVTVTWSSESGKWTMYLDGKEEDSGEGLATGETIPGGGVLVIGQEQDTLGGGFSASQEFLGTISQLNVYDYEMSAQDVLLLWRNCAQNLGNVRAWPEFAGGIVGRLEKTSTRFCLPCTEIDSDEGTVVTTVNNYTILVTCNVGHKLIFRVRNQQPSYYFRCGNDAGWKFRGRDAAPEYIKCVRITCHDIEEITLGHVKLTGEKYGDNATYSCVDGYHPVGDAIRTCQEDENWSGTPPTCEDIDECEVADSCHRKANCTNSIGSYSCECVHGWKGDGKSCREIYCGGAGSLIFGSIEGNNFKLGGVVRYSCDYGYRLEGPSERTCLFNDSWSEYMPECVKVECEEPEDIRHGYKRPRSPIWDYKSQITYLCQPGYELVGEPTRECGPDSRWTGSLPSCERVSCGTPPGLSNGVGIVDGDVKYGDIVRYICEQEYRLLGPQTMTCNASKVWEGKNGGSPPVCEHPTCDEPLSIIHGSFAIQEVGESTVTDAIYTYDTVVRYSCDVGYNLVGASNITCIERGSWDKTAPICEIVSCGSPPVVPNSLRDHNGELYSDLANYVCKPGYILEGRAALSCLASGKWTDNKQVIPLCNPRPCPTTRKVPHSVQTLSEAEGFVYKAVVRYNCNLGYWASGTDTINCDTEGQWQPAQDFQCDIAICPEPTPPEYGSVGLSEPSPGHAYEYNNTILYSCYSGFYSVGKMVARCTEFGNWSSSMPECLPIECPMPAVVMNSDLSLLDGPYGTGALFESHLSYTCDSGYEKSGGDAIRKCEHDKSWTGSPPECSRVSCGKAPVVTHAISLLQAYEPGVTGNTVLYRDQIIYYCNTGFFISGYNVIECTSSREFSDAPICKAKSCGDPPLVAYATYVSDDVYGENVYQSTLTYTCERDFRMSGDPVRVCDENGRWTMDDPPVCDPITCEEPDLVSNSFQFVSASANDVAHPELYKSGKYQPRAAAITACEKGYKVLDLPSFKSAGRLSDGPNTATASDEEMARSITPDALSNMDDQKQDRIQKVLAKFLQSTPEVGALTFKSSIADPPVNTLHLRQCSESVGWLKSAPICVPMICSIPFQIENGHRMNDDSEPHHLEFRQSVEYTCDEGYKFADANSTRETRSSICEWSDDIWNVYLTSVPLCLPLPCPAAPMVDHGPHSEPSGETFVFKDVVTYSCDNGYELTSGSESLSCEANQSWSGVTPVCSPVKCPEPISPENGKFKGTKWIYESTISFKCSKGYNLVGEANLTCLANRSWSDAYPKCDPVPCGSPPKVTHAETVATSKVYLGCAGYICEHGFHLKGYSELKCTASGKWRKEPPTCEFTKCGKPSLQEHVFFTHTAVNSPFLGSYVLHDIVTYDCEEGYETDDTDPLSAECLVENIDPKYPTCTNITLYINEPVGRWSRTPPVCTAKNCGTPPIPRENAFSVGEDTIFNSTVYYKCKKGYFTDDTTPFAICLSNASWSRSTSPTCQPVPCGSPDTPKNGYFNGTVFTYQGEIQYGCDAGHNLLGNSSIRCLAKGVWSGPAPVCEPKDCGNLSLIQHGTLEFEDTIFGEEAFYSCNSGYYLKGKSVFECQATGKWSHPTPPSCLPKSCGVLKSPANGILNAAGHVFMDIATYSCNSGYYLVGANHTECMATALWSEPTPECKPVDCGIPHLVDNGHSIKTGATTFESYWKFGCDRGYEMEGTAAITCQANKTWSPPPACHRVKCPAPYQPVNGLISTGASFEYRYEDQVTYSCKQGYFTDDVTDTECTASRTWSNSPPTCSPVDCGELPTVAKGIRNGWTTTFMNVITFSCRFGYHIIGNSSLECLHTALWSSGVPSCERISCGRPFRLRHGKTINGDITDNWLYGETVVFACDEGYHLHGSSGVECDGDGTWVFNYNNFDEDSLTYDEKTAEPVCEMIKCQRPVDIGNGSFEEKEYAYGDIVAYKCDEGYNIAKDGEVNCTGKRTTSTGFYSGKLPVCNPVSCGQPRAILNGQVGFESTTFKNKATYMCDPGYKMIGEATVICMANRHWSASPRCVPKDCGLPDLPEYTNMKISSTLFPTTLNVSCEKGYHLEGPSTMKCTENGTWSNERSMKCFPVSCGPPQKLKNGSVTFADIVFKKSAFYQCHRGFYMLQADRELTNNSFVVKCQSDGEWESGVPHCEAKICGLPPETDNGSSDSDTEISYPETVTYHCDYGFEFDPSADSSIQCADSGQFSSPPPKCRPVSCGAPISIPNSVVNVEAYTYLNIAVYSCNDGHYLDTGDYPSEQFGSQCTGEREWSPLPPAEGCRLYDCGPPLILRNAEAPPFTRNTKYGDLFTYECVKGHEAPEHNLTITCQRYGMWSEGPSCEPVNCGDYECAKNAKCEFVDTIYESVVTSQCIDGYQYQPNVTKYKVQCQEDATWSVPENISNPNLCERLSCGEPPVISNGKAVSENASSNSFQSLYHYECLPGFDLSGEHNLISCLTDGTWGPGPLPNCVAKDCGEPPSCIENANCTYNATTFRSYYTVSCNEGFEVEFDLYELDVVCNELGEWSIPPSEYFQCLRIHCGVLPEIGNGGTKENGSNPVYQDKVGYLCDDGYYMQGNAEVTCQSNRHYTEPPICTPVSCGDPSGVENGHINSTGEIFESEVIYSCDTGYFLFGQRNWVCAADAKWQPVIPESSFTVLNAPMRSLSTHDMQVMFSEASGMSDSVEGSGMSIDDEGKDVRTLTTITRTEADVMIEEMTDSNPECRPIPCGIPPVVVNAVVQFTDVLVYNESVSYNCKPGFEMIGKPTLTCQSSGKLGPSPPPICTRVECPIPEPLKNCDLTASTHFKFEEKLTYRPLKGYEFDPPGPPSMVITCTKNRTSDISTLPSCVPVSCGKPNGIFNGRFHGNSFTYQENITYVCDKGYEMRGKPSITCLSNRKWSLAPPVCSPVSCGDLNRISHGRMELNRGDTDPFSFKQTVNFTCNMGYMFQDEAEQVTLTCLHNKNWDGVPPTCVPVPCPEFDPVINGEITYNGEAVFKSTANFKCDVGHEMLGEPVLVCEATGSWSSDAPTCNPVSCDHAPMVPHSNHQSPQELSFGEEIVYECTPGYKLEGDATLRCLESRNFDYPPPVCSPIECEKPADLKFGYYEEEGFLFMNSIMYKCNEGYEMVSEDDSLQNTTATCLANKTWSRAPPECVIKSCGNPQSIVYGAANYSEVTYQSMLAYKCNAGYEIDKTSSNVGGCSDNEFCMICQSNAIWGNGNSDETPHPPICSPVSCGEPPEMDNADLESSSMVYQGSTLYVCHDGYEFTGHSNITITCEENAKWSEWSQHCTRVKCHDPPVVQNGKLEIVLAVEADSADFLYEDVISYVCEHGYQPSVFLNLTCGDDKNWDSDPPTCEPVDCGAPPARDHGYPVTYVKKQLKTTFQSVVVYACDDGFEFNGNISEEELSCTADGVWSLQPPPCTAVDCGLPTVITHGYYTLLTNETTFRSKVQYTCDVGHQISGDRILKCRADKSWTPSAPKCLPVSCTVPPNIGHGYPIIPSKQEEFIHLDDPMRRPKKRDVSAVSQFVYEDTVPYACDVGYNIKIGPESARCDENAAWVDLPTCSIIECDPLPNRNNSRKLEESHVYDSTVTYECDEGYILADGTTSIDCICKEQGLFAPVSEKYEDFVCKTLLPECKRISCGRAPVLRKGVILEKQKEYFYQDEIYYECAEGYKMIGESILRCQSNGIYNHAPPRCRRISCGTPPSVKNAFTVVQNGTKFMDIISYECRPGYSLVSDAYERVCTSDGTWTDDVVQCDPINCTDVAPPENADVVTPNDTTFGSTLTFKCQQGYDIIGRQSISCNASGEWSSFLPECMPVLCNPIPEVDFGIPFSTFMMHRFKDEVKFICLDGYILEGSDTISCLSSGAWTTPPRCYPIKCPDVPYISHATIPDRKETYTFMDMVFYQCDFGYSLSSADSGKSCQANGVFSDEIITCSRIPCPPSPEIAHGTASAASGLYGDWIEYHCDEGYEMLGSDSLSCWVDGMQGEWSGTIPVCSPVSCGSAPPIANGNKISEAEEYFYKESATYECDKGHKFHGPSVASCGADRNFSVTKLNCVPVTCTDLVLISRQRNPSLKNVQLEMEPAYSGDMNVPELLFLPDEAHAHSIIDYTSEEKVYLSEAYVTCERGYFLKSEKGEEKFVCQATKQWDGDFEGSECLPVKCMELPKLVDGDVEIQPSPEIHHHDNQAGSDNTYIYLTKAIFTFDDGYLLEGAANVTCTADGRWSSLLPRCIPVSCGKPPYIDNSVPIESIFTFGMIAEYECVETYILGENKLKTCQADGTYSNEKVECIPILCPTIPSSDHGMIRRNVARVGDDNYYVCDEGYESSSRVECLQSGEWNGGLEPCTPVQCVDLLTLENAVLTNSDRNFEYKDQAVYICVQGHYLSDGSQTLRLTCQASGLFSQPNDSCSPVECDLKKTFGHGQLHKDDGVAVFGEFALFICDEGYKNYLGDEKIYCTDNGEWDMLDASCDIIACGTAPDIPNAKPLLDEDNVYLFNDTVQYRCDEGYENLGLENAASCVSDGTFQGIEDVMCTPVVCPIPVDIKSGSLSKNEATYGQNLLIECDDGFHIDGHEEQDITLACQANGEWTEDISQISCSPIVCDLLEPLPFGSIILTDGEDEIIINPATDDLVSGSIIQYKCDTGYTLKGVSKQRCSHEGAWSGTLPYCNPVECGEPPFLAHGSIIGGDDYTYGDVVSYECDDGYRLYPEESSIRTCNEKGSWSQEHPLCEIKTCYEPAPVPNGEVDMFDVNYGSNIKIACEEGYFLTRGNEMRTCLSNGSWSGEEPVCEKSCGRHPPVQYGVVEPEDAMYIGEQVTITCEDGTDLFGDEVRVCRKDGEWEGILPQCMPFQVKNLQISLDDFICDPPVIPDVKAKLLKDQETKASYDDGDILEYRCTPGYVPAANMIIQCQHGEWSGHPQCVLKCRYKCQHNGRCAGNRRCSCSYGWKGARCHKPVCTSHCLNGGYCSGPNLCTCKSGWTGTRCGEPLCSKPCQNGGRCTSPDECYCPFGYGGVDCTESSFFNIW